MEYIGNVVPPVSLLLQFMGDAHDAGSACRVLKMR